jgi:hypothetical protein
MCILRTTIDVPIIIPIARRGVLRESEVGKRVRRKRSIETQLVNQ